MDLNQRYEEVVSEIDKIFESYSTLHGLYSTVFDNLKKNLTDLAPAQEARVERSIEIFESQKRGVEARQVEISNQLYAQGLVLLVGSAESLLRESFKRMIVSNPNKITEKKAGSVTLTFDEVRKAVNENPVWLGELLYEKLRDEKNPEARLNFQNMQQLKNILKDFLGIDFNHSDLFQNLHLYWQMRHIVIHNSSIIDERFIKNLQAAEIAVDSYKIGSRISITKREYEDCQRLYKEMFEKLTESISSAGFDEVSQ